MLHALRTFWSTGLFVDVSFIDDASEIKGASHLYSHKHSDIFIHNDWCANYNFLLIVPYTSSPYWNSRSCPLEFHSLSYRLKTAVGQSSLVATSVLLPIMLPVD